jgi:hypothetical protein
MLYRTSIAVDAALALCLAVSQVSAEVFAYPKKGQSQQQFEQDQFGCHQWTKGQTGVDPTRPPSSAAAPPPSALLAVPLAVMRGRGRPWGPGGKPGRA